MAGAKHVVEMDGDSHKLWQAWERVINQEAKAAVGLTKIGSESRKAAKEEREMFRVSKQMYDQSRTPQQRYNDRLAKAGDLFKSGRIQLEAYSAETRAAGAEMDRAGEKTQKAYGPAAQNQLKKLITMLGPGLGLLGAVRLVTKAFGEMAEARKEAGARLSEAEMGLGKLSQLAGGDPEKLKALVKKSVQFMAYGGAPTLGEAATTMFELESAGATTDAQVKFFAQLYGIDNPAELATAAGKLRAGFGPKEAGTFREIMSKGVAAAAPVTGVGINEILQASLPGASVAAELGISDEELLAAVSILAQKAKSADVGGTQIEGLLRSLQKRGFVEEHKGKSLIEMLDVIRKEKMDTPELIEYFGRKEAAAGFSRLQPKEFGERLASINKAQADNTIDQIIKSRAEVPAIQIPREARIAKGEELLSTLDMGETSQRADTLQSKLITGLRKQKSLDWMTPAARETLIWTIQKDINWTRWFPGGDERFIENMKGINRNRAANQAARSGLPPPPPDSAITEIVRDNGAPSMQPPVETLAPLLEENNRQLEQINQTLQTQKAGGPTLAKPDEDR